MEKLRLDLRILSYGFAVSLGALRFLHELRPPRPKASKGVDIVSRVLSFALLILLCATSCSADQSNNADWELASPDKADLDSERLEELSRQIAEGAFPNVHAVLVARLGKLGYEQYAGDFDPAERHYTASVSKTVGSILFGMLLDSGKIEGVGSKGLDTPLSELLPEHREIFKQDPQKKSLLLRHVLTMSDGLEWDESTYPYSDPRNDWRQASASEDPVAFVLARPFANDPGHAFNYNGGMSIILSYLIQRGAGRPADEYAKDHLFEPLGINDFEWERLRSGLADTDGGLHLRPRDMAKIGQLYLQKGIWNGKRIVSEDWVRESTRVHMVNVRSPGYGFQWWCGDYQSFGGEVYTFLASGHRGQRIYVFPSLDMVVVIANQVFDNPMGDLVCDAIIGRHVLPAANPDLGSPGPTEADADPLARYVGRWGHGEQAVTISLAEGVLYANAQGAPTLELVPVGQAQFIGTVMGLLDVFCTFELDEDGLPTALIARHGFSRERLERNE